MDFLLLLPAEDLQGVKSSTWEAGRGLEESKPQVRKRRCPRSWISFVLLNASNTSIFYLGQVFLCFLLVHQGEHLLRLPGDILQ